MTAREVMRLRPYQPARLELLAELADIYGAKPAPGNSEAVFDFLQTVYSAGRIEGIRGERKRRKRATA